MTRTNPLSSGQCKWASGHLLQSDNPQRGDCGGRRRPNRRNRQFGQQARASRSGPIVCAALWSGLASTHALAMPRGVPQRYSADAHVSEVCDAAAERHLRAPPGAAHPGNPPRAGRHSAVQCTQVRRRGRHPQRSAACTRARATGRIWSISFRRRRRRTLQQVRSAVQARGEPAPVSYTHLTLPTKRIV